MWHVVFEFYRWEKLRSKVADDLPDTKNSTERYGWDQNHCLLASKPREVWRRVQVPLLWGFVLRLHNLPLLVLSKVLVIYFRCIIDIGSGSSGEGQFLLFLEKLVSEWGLFSCISTVGFFFSSWCSIFSPAFTWLVNARSLWLGARPCFICLSE